MRQTRVSRNGLAAGSTRPPSRASWLADGQVRATAHIFSREGSAQVFHLLLRLLGHTTQTRCQTRRAEANNNNALNRKHWRILLCVLCVSPSTLATVAGAKPFGAHGQRQHGARKPSFDPWLFFLGLACLHPRRRPVTELTPSFWTTFQGEPPAPQRGGQRQRRLKFLEPLS